jgi:hypothetical protein
MLAKSTNASKSATAEILRSFWRKQKLPSGKMAALIDPNLNDLHI